METAQEIFDTVARHLIAQGAQSITDDGHCRYRADDGKRCAVGCLFTDEEYRPSMEGHGVSSVMLPGRLKPHSMLLRDLQRVHDVPAMGHGGIADLTAQHFIPRLHDVAERHGLSTDVLMIAVPAAEAES